MQLEARFGTFNGLDKVGSIRLKSERIKAVNLARAVRISGGGGQEREALGKDVPVYLRGFLIFRGVNTGVLGSLNCIAGEVYLRAFWSLKKGPAGRHAA